jgi:hypothetical protein
LHGSGINPSLSGLSDNGQADKARNLALGAPHPRRRDAHRDRRPGNFDPRSGIGSAQMNALLSFLISAGIIAFGLWAITCAIKAGLPIGFTLIGTLAVAIGSVSFYESIREARREQIPVQS